ncbi:hypothetical protein [Rosenbergiella nectarea]|uniref:hypothetical protein n=1 Tax=Rosenbergiella nectarea TaxID=988801 RepID=UPI001BD96E43|nr:hypothetical protein [Rosenbergiella nectarea]MBT0729513.1 hypothetical protein [Rosenbergiella nectarea subsp. apis]
MGGIAKGIGKVVGSVTGSNAAAKAQTNAANQSNATALQIYNQQQTTLHPFLQTGLGGLQGLSMAAQNSPDAAQIGAQNQAYSQLQSAIGSQSQTSASQASAQNQAFNNLQGMTGINGMGSFLNDYYNSAAYNQQANQARYQQLAAAEATGGLGASATSNQLASIAPSLGQQAYNQQLQANTNLYGLANQAAQQNISNYSGLFNTAQSANNNQYSQLLGLTNVGLSAGGATNAAAGEYSSAAQNNLNQIGAAKAGNLIANGSALLGLAGLGAGLYSGGLGFGSGASAASSGLGGLGGLGMSTSFRNY